MLSAVIGQKKLDQLDKCTDLPAVELSAPCQALLTKIAACAPSDQQLRRIVREDVLEGATFDPVVHADLNFVESFATHLYVLNNIHL